MKEPFDECNGLPLLTLKRVINKELQFYLLFWKVVGMCLSLRERYCIVYPKCRFKKFLSQMQR